MAGCYQKTFRLPIARAQSNCRRCAKKWAWQQSQHWTPLNGSSLANKGQHKKDFKATGMLQSQNCSAISVIYKWLSIIVVTGYCCLEGTITAMLQFHSTAGGFIWRMEVFTPQNKKGLWNSLRKESFEPSSILETLAVFEGSFASTFSCKILEHGTRRRAAAAVWRDLPDAAVPNGHPALLRSWRKSPVEDSTGKSWDD